MSGLTNWFRANALAVIQGTSHAALAETWVNVLTTLPTSEATNGTTDEVEWSLSRVEVNIVGPTEPFWDFRLSADDGAELFNTGAVTWSTGDTSGLSGDTIVLGLGVYTASTAGILLAYDDFVMTATVVPGDTFIFATDKIRIQMRSDL